MMRKIIFVAIVGVALLLGGCKRELITTQYSIGCQGYQYGSVHSTPEEWDNLQSYFSTHVDYNKLVTFESTSLAENDAKARAYFDEQIQKIEVDSVCSLLHDQDYFDYGIATHTAHGDYQMIKAMRFNSSGAHLLNVK